MEKMKKMKEMEKMKLPPDGQRCCQTNGSLRCKNFRMSHCAADGSVPKTKFCEKHYNYAKAYKMKKLLKKNTSADGDQDAGSRGLKRRRKKVPGKDDETEIQQGATTDDTCGTGNIRRKRKHVERAEDGRFVDEDSISYVDSENSVGDLMDMLGMEKLELEQRRNEMEF
ncbi:hypothetical protein C5167_040900 [Papaver somniferum]|uniref:WRC domain-containing protein n=1 Tax=Papaver somniferum TaxID=3469 RepID=A0A4Y7IJL5_PAPSO|nr:hypothetical protein C5167_040900 [Papaver somniferum]